MLKRTVTFNGFDGKEHTQDIYLNVTRPEVFKFMKAHGIASTENAGEDFQTYIKDTITKNDVVEMMDMIEEILLLAYGEKDEDGVHFRKSPAIREEFSSSLAYEALFNAVLDDPGFAEQLGKDMAK